MSEYTVPKLQLQSNYNTIPPQVIDAEEPILGGIMLDPNALDRVINILSPEMFYVPAHQEIYRAAIALREGGSPTDFMTVTSWLYDHKSLDKVGGQNKIAQLLERTVSAVNIDRYAALVRDKFVRRLFIQSGNELVSLSLDQANETSDLIELTRKRLERIVALQTEDKSEAEYSQLMDKAEKIILYEDNPGKRAWDLGKLAKQYRLNAKTLEDIYFKHLVHKDSEPRYTWEELLQHEDDSQKWLLYGFMPRKSLTLLHGKAGDSKTRFLIGLLMKVAKGLDLKSECGTFAVPRPGRVLIIQTDETKPETIETLQSYGMQAGLQVEFLTTWTVEEMPRLLRELKDYRPDAVLIDSLSSVSQYSCVEESDSRYAKPILAMREYAGKFNCWIGVIHHSNRDGQARGTTALEAAASTVMKIERLQGSPPSSGKRLVSITKSRSRRPTTYLVEADWEAGEWNFLEETTGWFSPESSIKEQIFAFLQKNANVRYETREISETLNLSSDSTRRAAYQMASDGIISKARKGNRNLYWVERDDGGGGKPEPETPAGERDNGGEDHIPGTGAEPEAPGADLDMEPEPEAPAGDRIDEPELVSEMIRLIQDLLEIRGSNPWEVLRNAADLNKVQKQQVLRKLSIGKGHRIVHDMNNPDWGIINSCLIQRGVLIDFRPFPGISNSLYAYCSFDDGFEGYMDWVDLQEDDCIEPDPGAEAKALEPGLEPDPGAEAKTLEPGLEPDPGAEAKTLEPGLEPDPGAEAKTLEPGLEPDPGAEAKAPEPREIFDRIQVGDRLTRNGTTMIVAKKTLSPKEVEIKDGADTVRKLNPSELEVLRFQHEPLRTGTQVRYGEYTGVLAQRCKNHKWFVRWDKRSKKWVERYGCPPSKALLPDEFEVIK
ncbi:MAG: DnaB-like helicase N-terminal domain-containing protein [Coleofasciculus sp. G1-WW12-02]|uniref:DnaB-like helicase N-terminal domain-containing protein n=1 Tax=Coleofasciculus sp. G1-WW12-02 TaxID=3068483 RepID=UPI0032FE1EA5